MHPPRGCLPSLNPQSKRINELFKRSPAAAARHARQIGLILITPTCEAQQGDLVSASNGCALVDADDQGEVRLRPEADWILAIGHVESVPESAVAKLPECL